MFYDPKHISNRFFSVDCIIFAYEQEQLKLLLFKRQIEPSKGMWSLIGGWVKELESVESAAQRVLHQLTGLKDVYFEQVETFSKPERDPGGNVVTIAFNALIKIEEHSNELINQFGAQWFPISEVPSLIFDHDEMVKKALDRLRLRASYELIGRQLLPEKFTLTTLRNLYNEVYQKQFDASNFRKKVLSLKILQRLDEKDMSESKKGAYYYKFKAKDESSYPDPIFKRSI